jgi:hypothetical protein
VQRLAAGVANQKPFVEQVVAGELTELLCFRSHGFITNAVCQIENRSDRSDLLHDVVPTLL